MPNGSRSAGGAAYRLLRRIVDVELGEVRALVLACLYFFFLLSSYFVLRPVRDAMAVASGVRSLPWLFAGTLGAMLLASPLFAALVVRFPVKRFIAITYQFFAANLVLFSVLRRATNFSLTNPSMEVLFTVVPREDKYKAKSFIETFVYRAGDQVAAWSYAGLAALGLALTGIAWVAVPLSALFLAVGVRLGRRQQEMARDEAGAADAQRAASSPVAAAVL